MSWGTPEGDKTFRDAISAIEDNSSVECVVAVRARARLFLAQHITVGLVATYAVLIFAVLNEWPAWSTLVFPIAAGLVSALLVEYLPPLYRFLVPAALREHHVLTAARALFVEKRIHATRDRTGLLIFVAVRDRIVEVIADVGIVDALGQTRLDHMAQTLRVALADGPAALGRTLANLAPEFAEVLPRKADDTNELVDDVVAVPPA
jgi:putative membrane protein